MKSKTQIKLHISGQSEPISSITSRSKIANKNLHKIVAEQFLRMFCRQK